MIYINQFFKKGILCSRGSYLLFVDADGATKFSDFDILEEHLKRIENEEKHGIVVGSRAHLVSKVKAKVFIIYFF